MSLLDEIKSCGKLGMSRKQMSLIEIKDAENLVKNNLIRKGISTDKARGVTYHPITEIEHDR